MRQNRVSFEDQIRTALDGASTALRQHLEADLKAFAQEIARAASEDRQRSIDAATASARSQAEAQINQYREAAQKHTEHLKHVAENQIADLRKASEFSPKSVFEVQAQASAKKHIQELTKAIPCSAPGQGGSCL